MGMEDKSCTSTQYSNHLKDTSSSRRTLKSMGISNLAVSHHQQVKVSEDFSLKLQNCQCLKEINKLKTRKANIFLRSMDSLEKWKERLIMKNYLVVNISVYFNKSVMDQIICKLTGFPFSFCGCQQSTNWAWRNNNPFNVALWNIYFSLCYKKQFVKMSTGEKRMKC